MAFLLRAAAIAVAAGWISVTEDVALDVMIRSPTPQPAGDATNCPGGIADVLQGRRASSTLDVSHLGGLGNVAPYADDVQIQQVMYRAVQGEGPWYSVQVTIL